MKAAIAPLSILAATPALAHPGHLTEAAGHSHWYVLGALALALAIAGAALWRGGRAKKGDRAGRSAAAGRRS